MTDPLQALIDHLRTLEAQWRERSKEWRDDEDELMYTNGPDLLESCADELAAALAGSAGIPSSDSPSGNFHDGTPLAARTGPWVEAGIPSSLNSETKEEDLTRRDSLPLTEAPQPAPTDWDPSSPWPEGYSSYWRCVRCGQVYSSPTTGKPPAQCLCPPAGVVTVTVSSQSQSSAILKSSVSRRSGLSTVAAAAEAKQRDAVEAARVANLPPVDRSALCTTDGRPPEEARASQTNETGQHASYIVLCDSERAKGFVRPYRDRYKHTTCGGVTTMGRALSETYARDPGFYGATFCVQCNRHLPVSEFVWTADGAVVGS